MDTLYVFSRGKENACSTLKAHEICVAFLSFFLSPVYPCDARDAADILHFFSPFFFFFNIFRASKVVRRSFCRKVVFGPAVFSQAFFT